MTRLIPALFLLITFLTPLTSQTKKIQMRKEGVYVPPKHQRANKILPNEIKTRLDSQFPGWTFADNYYIFDVQDGDLTQQKYPFDPNFISGDFDGDDHQDYAVQIVNPGEPDSTDLFLAFVWSPQGFKQSLLQSIRHFYLPDEYLWLSKKGTKGYDVESDSSFVFPRDAITIEIWEKASTTYLYSDGTFNEILTGD